jgi:hypothetical protein
MLICNVGFIDVNGKQDETELDIEEYNTTEEEVIELINLILSLKDEMGIKEITYIEYMECDDEEDD